MHMFWPPSVLIVHYRWGCPELHLASSMVRLGCSRWGQQGSTPNNSRTRQPFPTTCPNSLLSWRELGVCQIWWVSLRPPPPQKKRRRKKVSVPTLFVLGELGENVFCIILHLTSMWVCCTRQWRDWWKCKTKTQGYWFCNYIVATYSQCACSFFNNICTVLRNGYSSLDTLYALSVASHTISTTDNLQQPPWERPSCKSVPQKS